MIGQTISHYHIVEKLGRVFYFLLGECERLGLTVQVLDHQSLGVGDYIDIVLHDVIHHPLKEAELMLIPTLSGSLSSTRCSRKISHTYVRNSVVDVGSRMNQSPPVQ